MFDRRGRNGTRFFFSSHFPLSFCFVEVGGEVGGLLTGREMESGSMLANIAVRSRDHNFYSYKKKKFLHLYPRFGDIVACERMFVVGFSSRLGWEWLLVWV